MDNPTPQDGTPKAKPKKAEAQATEPRVSVSVHKAKLPKGQKARHSAASALHGWHEHEHDKGSPLELTADEYAAALEAASHRDPVAGKYIPHAPALAERKSKRVEASASLKKAREESRAFEATRDEQFRIAREEARKTKKAKAVEAAKAAQKGAV